MAESGWQLWHVYLTGEKFWYHRESGHTAGYQKFEPVLTIYLPGSRGLSLMKSVVYIE